MRIFTRDLDFVNFNNLNMEWVKFNGVTVFEAWKRLMAEGAPPLLLEKCRGDKYKLPQGYMELDYIDATGEQYINTEFCPNSSSAIEIEAWVYAADAEVSKNTFIFGTTEGSENEKRFAYNLFYSSYSHTFGAYPRFSINAPENLKNLELNKWYTYRLDQGKFYVNNELIASYSETFERSEYPLYINAYNSAGVVNSAYIGVTRIRKCKVWDNGVLVRDYIPCYNSISGDVGLYDLIEGKMYPSVTSKPFIKGSSLLLPEEYQEVEYIEADGTQYIDMKYSYVVNDEINIRFMKTQDTGAIQGVFGNGNLTPYTGTVLYINGTNILTSTIGGALGVQFFKYEEEPIQNNQIYEVKYTANKVFLNNEHIITVANELVNGDQDDFSLFRRWNTNSMYGRIYSFNIRRGGTFVVNMVPCYRKIDGVAGMYDLISNVFYQNAGTGEFIKGTNTTHTKEPSVINYQVYGNSVSSTGLPIIYQQVEYIESTGTQHIDTGVPLVDGLKMIVDWVYADADSSNSYTGGHIGSPGVRWLIGSQRQNKRYFFAISGVNLNTEFQFGNRDVVEAYWKSKNSYIKVNGVESQLQSWTNYSYNADASNYTFYLGATNRDGNATLKPKLKIYGCKFYIEDTLVRDYIPCYYKQDGTIGLYDLVEGKFYSNDGTGEFLKGDNFADSKPVAELYGTGDKTANLLDIENGAETVPDISLTKTDDNIYTIENLSSSHLDVYFPFENNKGKYTFMAQWEGEYPMRIMKQDKTTLIVLESGVPTTFSSNEDKFYVRYSIPAKGTIIIEKPQLLKGDTIIDYEPFGYKIPITTTSKNLLNISTTKNGTIHGSAGTDVDTTSNRVRTDYIFLKKGVYCISTKKNIYDITVGLNFHLYEKPDVSTWMEVISVPELYSTEDRYYRILGLNKDCYVRCVFVPNIAQTDRVLSTDNIALYEPQIEIGEYPSSYSQWRCPDTTNVYIPEPLLRGGDYADYIDYATQTLTGIIGEYEFNGSENWELHTTISGGCVFRLDEVLTPLINAPQTSTQMTLLTLTNTYSTSSFKPGYYRLSSDKEVTRITGNRIYISTEHTTVEEFKEWLSINKPKIYYPIDSPTSKSVVLPSLWLAKGENVLTTDTIVSASNIKIEYYGKPQLNKEINTLEVSE